jgi:hypothetical protein
MNLLKTGLLIIGFITSAFPLTVDFAPIQVGNVWVFEQSFKNMAWYTIQEYKITKTIQITKTNIKGDTTFFTAFVKDSGVVGQGTQPQQINAAYYVEGYRAKDTLLSKKSDDSIVVSEQGIEKFNLNGFFPHPIRDTATLDTGHLAEKFYLWENNIVDLFVYFYQPYGGVSDTCLLLQNVGLLHRSYCAYVLNGGDMFGGTTTTNLMSFNGKPAPVVPLSVSSFSRRTSFSSRQSICGQLLLRDNGRLMSSRDGRTIFDVQGRLMPMSSITHQRITSGIFFSKKAGNVTQQ